MTLYRNIILFTALLGYVWAGHLLGLLEQVQ